MPRVMVANWVTLDGVMQAPGRPDEDTRGGFARGGWAMPFSDELIGAKMGELMSGGHAWLFGRTSYESLLASWNEQGGPFQAALNDTTKYVASSNPDAALPWPNTVLVHGDVPQEVAQLKSKGATDLIIMGSGVLINSLIAADLIDDYLLVIAPIVLGTGRRLFAEGNHASLHLCECTPTSASALIARYERARNPT